MKLASLKEGRDGKLVVVSQDLTQGKVVGGTLQQALDEWARVAPQLEQESFNMSLDVHALGAPLPRAYQWADGSAYVTHVELVRKARGAQMPASFWTDPLMYQGGPEFMAWNAPIVAKNEEWGIDFEAEVAVITDDVPMGVTPEAARGHIKLVAVVNDVSLRNLIPDELGKGFGFFQSKPASAMSPVVVTPDELGQAWDGGRLHLPLRSFVNGQRVGEPNAGVDMTFDFGQLIAHAAKTRSLCAGSVIGSGTVANKDEAVGSSCLAEVRMRETLRHGAATTPFLRFGDRVRIEMKGFGAIDQVVAPG